jgi:MFS family permease
VALALQRRRSGLITELRERGSYQNWVLITCLFGVFATSFPVTILTVSLGDIAKDFGTTETLIAWVVSAPMLAGAVALPMLGRLGDVLGQRRVFLVGFALSGLTAAFTAVAWGPFSLIGFRTLSQVIGAGTGPTSMALIMRETPRNDRVKAMGWSSLVGAGAPAIGLAIGGPLVQAIGWRPVFIAQAVLSLFPVVAAWFVLEEIPVSGEERHFDVRGAAALAVSAGAIMFGLTQGRSWGWTHPGVLAAGLIAPVAAYLFVRIERTATSPLLPLTLLNRPRFVRPLGAEFFAGAAYMGAFVITPLFLRGVLGWALSSVALLMLLRPAALSLASPVGGFVAAKIGEQRTALGGLVLLTGSMALFSFAAFGQIVFLVGLALVLQGTGMGFYGPPIGAIYVNSVDDDSIGMATATQRMVQQIGNALGISLLVSVYGGVATDAAFGRAYLAAMAVATVALVIVISIGRTGPLRLPRRLR